MKIGNIFDSSIQVLFRIKNQEEFKVENFLQEISKQLKFNIEEIIFEKFLNENLVEFTIKNKEIVEILRKSDFRLKNFEDIEIQIVS